MTEKKTPVAGNVTIERIPNVKHENLAAALAAVQSEIPSVAKGATAEVQTKAGGTYRYQYADLAVITPLILPLLGKNGLAWSTRPTMMGNAFVLDYTLSHEGGESIEGVYPLPDPLTCKPQEIGSAITYARRYALCAVTGIAPGGDDDDAAAANEKPAAGRKPTPPSAPPRDWKKAIADAKDLDTLTALAAEAQADGHWGDTIVDDAGETTVGQALHARRERIQEATTPPLAGVGKVEPRAWLDEAKAFEYSDEASALWKEADALGANSRILTALEELAGRLPQRPAASEGEPGWAPVSEDTAPKDEVEGAAVVLDESIAPEVEK